MYNDRVTIRKALTALLLAGVACAGCGGAKSSQAASPWTSKNNARAYDSVDVCSLATDAELQAALGEAPGTRDRRDDDTLKGCSVDGSSRHFYLFVTVRRSPAGAQVQFNYDRSAAPQPQNLGDVGGDAFSYTAEQEAHVEALDGDLVVRVSFVFYAEGGTVSSGPELLSRLTALAKKIVQRI